VGLLIVAAKLETLELAKLTESGQSSSVHFLIVCRPPVTLVEGERRARDGTATETPIRSENNACPLDKQ